MGAEQTRRPDTGPVVAAALAAADGVAGGQAHGRLRSIDLLRGTAALAVVLHHAVNYGNNMPRSVPWFDGVHAVLDLGHLGVPLFFVISGFCIHLKWARHKRLTGESSLAFVPFWARRLRRLYPPYVIMLCLSMGLVLLAYLRKADVPLVTAYPQPRLRWMGWDFLLHLGMLHGFSPLCDRMGGNPPFWTLAREEYFYLLFFPLLCWRNRWGSAGAFGLVVLVGLATPPVMAWFLPPDSSWWSVVNTSAFVLWTQWCLGMLAAEAYWGLVRLPRVFSHPLAAFAWAALAYYLGPTCPPAVAALLWGLAFFTLLNFCVRRERNGRWPNWAMTNWLTKVGVFSYSLYLVHNPARAVVKQLLGSSAETSNPVVYLAYAALMAVAGCVAGLAFFWLVERHFLFDARGNRPRTPAIADPTTGHRLVTT